ncbi:hypothetical protein, partial [Salmonella enterica]|uniref:hypothetical protein n=1 Tax=Salmonella enterica TaxID=28901 RepID=UPI003CF4120D
TDSVVRNLTSDPKNDNIYTFSTPNGNVLVRVEFIPDDVPKPEHKLTLHLVDPNYDPIDTTAAPYDMLIAELQKNIVSWTAGSLKID